MNNGNANARDKETSINEDDDNECTGLAPATRIPLSLSMAKTHGGLQIGFNQFIWGLKPVILWSFPGGGNTWCRLLIEAATGYLTGSVYNDLQLKKNLLIGEGVTSRQVIAVKAHPTSWTYKRLALRFGRTFSAILLVRDPFQMFWSECQRRVSRVHTGGGKHRSRITHETLLAHWSKWETLALGLAVDYARMWMTEYTALSASGAKLLFVEFEALSLEETRDHELARAASFLGQGWEPKRAKCAFITSEGAHRRHDDVDGRQATIDDAFPIEPHHDIATQGNATQPSLACRVWTIVSRGERAARALGFDWTYTQLPGRVC
eukprot:m.273230 g.273230  ORF g.273230 m.273230 type:complete len:321 (-) comp105651_c0_seq1:179-1141(-)